MKEKTEVLVQVYKLEKVREELSSSLALTNAPVGAGEEPRQDDGERGQEGGRETPSSENLIK